MSDGTGANGWANGSGADPPRPIGEYRALVAARASALRRGRVRRSVAGGGLGAAGVVAGLVLAFTGGQPALLASAGSSARTGPLPVVTGGGPAGGSVATSAAEPPHMDVYRATVPQAGTVPAGCFPHWVCVSDPSPEPVVSGGSGGVGTTGGAASPGGIAQPTPQARTTSPASVAFGYGIQVDLSPSAHRVWGTPRITSVPAAGVVRVIGPVSAGQLVAVAVSAGTVEVSVPCSGSDCPPGTFTLSVDVTPDGFPTGPPVPCVGSGAAAGSTDCPCTPTAPVAGKPTTPLGATATTPSGGVATACPAPAPGAAPGG